VKMGKARKGFTMVELMVVIIIMAILGLAIMPALMGSSDKAKYSRAWSDLTAISNAFTAFYGRVGNLPTIQGSDLTAATFLKGTGTEWDDVTDPKALLQSFLGKPISKLEDPWGSGYGIISDWNPNDGTGSIIVYVTGGTSTTEFGVTSEASNVRTDPYNNDKVMAKLVINVPK